MQTRVCEKSQVNSAKPGPVFNAPPRAEICAAFDRQSLPLAGD